MVVYMRVISQIFQLGTRHSRHGTGSVPNRRSCARHCVQPRQAQPRFLACTNGACFQYSLKREMSQPHKLWRLYNSWWKDKFLLLAYFFSYYHIYFKTLRRTYFLLTYFCFNICTYISRKMRLSSMYFTHISLN